MTMIKTWFLEKNFRSEEIYVITLAAEGGELSVISESEKAVKFKADSDFGHITFWCPKSCLYTEEEYRAEMDRKMAAINRGLDYNRTLLDLAKSHGINGVRTGMKTATLMKKLRDNGIEIPERN